MRSAVQITRARHYASMGYSANRLAELFGLPPRAAQWIKVCWKVERR